MYRFLSYLFIWVIVGILVTTAFGIKTGFWWFVLLGLPAGIVVLGLLLSFVITTVGAFIGLVTPGKR